MAKILISSCLLGCKVRYDGKDSACDRETLGQWQSEGRLVAICPEVSAGLSIPRPSCEIVGGDGHEVFSGKAKVMTHTGLDRTDAFILGAENALQLALQHGIKMAILKKNSPSCGNRTRVC